MSGTGERERISRIMKHILWDYDIDPYELYEVVTRKRGRVGHFDEQRVLQRMLERLSWYDYARPVGCRYPARAPGAGDDRPDPPSGCSREI